MMLSRQLKVWLYGNPVARLTERRTGKFQLEYSEEAAEAWPSGRPVLFSVDADATRPEVLERGRHTGRRGPVIHPRVATGHENRTLLAVPMTMDNPVRSYAWGSMTAIPELLGIPPTGEPQAELWMGAHPGAPSQVEAPGGRVSLAQQIEDDPVAMLGSDVVERFGVRLPYLLKVLAVERPLSIQAHPTNEQAIAGYAAEEVAGIPLDAPERTYRDRSHKPEMVVALTEFEALLGFRAPTETAGALEELRVAALDDVAAELRADGTAGVERVFRRWIDVPDADVAELVAATVAGASRPAVDPSGPAGLVRRLAASHPGDRGIVLALLLNHVRLQPGEAAFTGAGVPHAYLSGVALEPQASSDNTIRAGLTGKHVDAQELMRILRYDITRDPRVTPEHVGEAERVFAPGVDEFRLTLIDLDGGDIDLAGGAPRIAFVVDGECELTASGRAIRLQRGCAAFIPAAEEDGVLTGRGTVATVVPDL